MDKYDKRLIAIAISKTMECDICPYPCRLKEESSYYSCENHWKKILDLIDYKTSEEEESH